MDTNHSAEVENLVQKLSSGNLDSASLSSVSKNLTNALPKLIEQLTSEYEKLMGTRDELQKQVEELTNSISTQKEVFLDALGSDAYNDEKMNILQPEAKNVVRDYINYRNRVNEIETKVSSIKDEIKKAQEYIEDYGLKNKEKPNLAPEYNELMDSIDRSLTRIAENVRVNLYRQISNALSTGQSDSLPSDLLELINTLVIDRLESVVKPYEELSAKYVSGQITHEQFTNQLRRNALYNLLREKLIEDIIHALENNNLTSPVLPPRLKTSVERIVNDAKNFAQIVNSDTDSKKPGENESMAQFSLKDKNPQ